MQAFAVFELYARLGGCEVVEAEAADVHQPHVERLEQVDEIPAHGTVVHFDRNEADAQAAACDRGQGNGKRCFFATHFGSVERVLVGH